MSNLASGTDPGLCYLCDNEFAEPTNADHVPPLQFHGDDIRRGNNLSQLLTIKVHKKCNEAYRLDEEYFVHTLMPLARGTYAGSAIYQEILGKFREGRNVPLVRMVLNEADPRPSGLVLPGGKVIKRFNGQRIQRVAWKIVRGLYFYHHHRVLPENHTTWVSLTPPGEQPPEHFVRFMQLPENDPKGKYPAIFDYRFQNFTEFPACEPTLLGVSDLGPANRHSSVP